MMIANRMPIDEQITALAKKHIAPGFDRLNAIRPTQTPYENTEMFKRVKAYTIELLAKYDHSAAPVNDNAACGAQNRECEDQQHDPLQSAANWLLDRIPGMGEEGIRNHLLIGPSRAASLFAHARRRITGE
ncbi:hypothetical protein H0A71_05910 [Alcaligenaceae bacterium]|nr:hypothetical protein [Alcaligenaceae bacterium]